MGENDAAPRETRFGSGSRIGDTGFIFRTALAGSATSTYDTGFVGAGGLMDPGTIAFGGSNAPQAGFFNLTGSTANLALELQKHFSTTSPEDITAQAYLESQLGGNGDLLVRHAYGRADLANINLLAGTYWTAWGDEGTLPRSLNMNTTAAGTIYQFGVPQLRLATALNNNWLASVAIQAPLVSTIDPTNPNDPGPPNPEPNFVLQRYPDLAMRLQYLDTETKYNTFSVGGLVRGLGIETFAGDEQIRTAWGVTANGRMMIAESSAIQGGVVGGRGLADDIFGLQAFNGAALSATNQLQLQSNCGAYMGFTQLVSDSMQLNLAYGLARGDSTTAVAPNGTFHKVQNAWANLIYRRTEELSIGLEYHWGENEIAGMSGGNHRILLAVQITPKSNGGSSTGGAGGANMAPEFNAAAAAAATEAPSVSPTMVPLPNNGAVSKYRRL
ncbi:MAG: hypothetical protein H7062_08780, partial [Candidatus Saccharimonas sp.]|nr:hypothetical protein [Planctomycetaceae bacterium]